MSNTCKKALGVCLFATGLYLITHQSVSDKQFDQSNIKVVNSPFNSSGYSNHSSLVVEDNTCIIKQHNSSEETLFGVVFIICGIYITF
jgi:hypothetical protein